MSASQTHQLFLPFVLFDGFCQQAFLDAVNAQEVSDLAQFDELRPLQVLATFRRVHKSEQVTQNAAVDGVLTQIELVVAHTGVVASVVVG